MAPPHLLDQRQEDRAAGRASLQRLSRAKQHQPRRFELMRAESRKRARPAEGEQAAVEIGENLMEIGKRDRKGLRNAVELDDDAEIRRHEKFQRVRVESNSSLVKGTKPQFPLQPSLNSSAISAVSPCFKAFMFNGLSFRRSRHSRRVEMRAGLSLSSLEMSKR